MNNSDSFINYTAEDLQYEFFMLNRCKKGRYEYKDIFLKNLCIEGWLLHARRLIEAFQLQTVDKKWEYFWGLISQHISHSKSANRKDHRSAKRRNLSWDIDNKHHKLIVDLKIVTEQYKTHYIHYDLLVRILEESIS